MAEEEKKEGYTAQQIQEMIIGSPEKMTLLNLFNGLMQENANLKKELEKLKNDKKKIKAGKANKKTKQC